MLTPIELPPLNELGPEPTLEPSVYEGRISRLRERMAASGLDAVVVYADREHPGNTSYLVGFDPRFEEALLLIELEGDPVILAGNESISFTEDPSVPLEGVLCQSFSLPNQDRSERRRISDALAEAGLDRRVSCGVVGWKPIPSADSPSGSYALAVPQFVLSEIEDYLDGDLSDATGLVAGLDGIKVVNEADQLALNEHRATRASHCIWNGLAAVQPGRTELDISVAMGLPGLPLACHVMCTSDPDRVNGLNSPTDRELVAGSRFSAAVGFWGGLCCRAGLVLKADDPGMERYIDSFASPYYGAIRTWYEALELGTSGEAVSEAVRNSLAPSEVRTLLDAGHLIHIEEWFDSPFWPGSTFSLRSGLALQCDIIPVSSAYPEYVANVEDSLAIADDDLRAELAERYPQMWSRVEQRRDFMTGPLGIDLRPEVLPFSDRQAAFTPALLSPDRVLL